MLAAVLGAPDVEESRQPDEFTWASIREWPEIGGSARGIRNS